MWTDLIVRDSVDMRTANLMLTLLRAPSQLGPLLEAALGPFCANTDATFGALLALSDTELMAAAVCEQGICRTTDPALLEPLLTQGIAGYAVARGTPLLLRDIGADPRWGPPSLDSSLPTDGAALAVPLGHPADAVLVLVAPYAGAFDGDAGVWAIQSLDLLRQPLEGALTLEHALSALDRLGARDSLRRDLSAMALHDMRNPLQNIQLAFKAINRLAGHSGDDACAGQVNDMIRMGQHSAAQLASLSKTLLDVARLEDQQVSLALQQAPIEPVVTSALAATGVLLEATGCHAEAVLAPNLPDVPHDPALIERVIANLIDNAIKHTPAGGLIEVSATPFATGVCVRVADSGPGIPPELREEIFSKYFQIRPQNGARLDGVGLGLAFCRLAVTAHGGEIWAENGEERGAVFAFTLPGPHDDA
ncbi:MAG: ATP-binding protein [Anaerolineae bacterium]